MLIAGGVEVTVDTGAVVTVEVDVDDTVMVVVGLVT